MKKSPFAIPYKLATFSMVAVPVMGKSIHHNITRRSEIGPFLSYFVQTTEVVMWQLASQIVPIITVRVDSLPHRKWKEVKQQPSMLPGPAVSGSCLVSFHFLWGKLSTRTVQYLTVQRSTLLRPPPSPQLPFSLPFLSVSLFHIYGAMLDMMAV